MTTRILGAAATAKVNPKGGALDWHNRGFVFRYFPISTRKFSLFYNSQGLGLPPLALVIGPAE